MRTSPAHETSAAVPGPRLATAIAVARPFHVELCYGILSHLDLGRDAASLYAPRWRRRPWAAALLDAYRAAPGRLTLHAVPLVVDDLPALRHAVADPRHPALCDDAGRALAARMIGAIDAEHVGARRRWYRGRRAADRRAATLVDTIAPRLATLRAALWESAVAPTLRVVDCDALAHPRGTHGRASVTTDGTHVVAVSLSASSDQVLCQILHEEMHPVTDGPIRARFAGVTQDTAAESNGFTLHRALEDAAVTRGQQLIDDHAPDLRPAYARWRATYGV